MIKFSKVLFSNYKALGNFSIDLNDTNILVGPNNCGKSTIIGAFRVLDIAIKKARSRNPEFKSIVMDSEEKGFYCYTIPEAAISISIENIHTNYSSNDSFVEFTLSNNNILTLYFNNIGDCVLITDPQVKKVTEFRYKFPVLINAVPILGPLEHKEEIVLKETVSKNLNTHRASRHFRNYWYYFPENFEYFANLVSESWIGMSITKPEQTDRLENTLYMFCEENRIKRELYWAGFGFQIWCQILTHISRVNDSSLILIDEPEIYLHPDIQRQLVNIIKKAGKPFLIATHSTEIMSEVEPNEILLIDKTALRSKRLKDIPGVQNAIDLIGSVQNITLTQIARTNKVIFFENSSDYRLINNFAEKFGYSCIVSSQGYTKAYSEGFGSWKKLLNFAQCFKTTTGVSVSIGTVYDRDYFCDEEIDFINKELDKGLDFIHIHQRKEIENYLLIPKLLLRVIKKSVKDISITNIYDIFSSISEDYKHNILSQKLAKRRSFLKIHCNDRRDDSSIDKDFLIYFDKQWSELDKRIAMIPGKDFFKKIKQEVLRRYNIKLTEHALFEEMSIEDIPEDFHILLKKLDIFLAKS